ncbi:hypothetical protein N7565_18645 [Acinetobacter baumannii]|uniref:hypothetical protein n=1 Tax=Acinetobacter baumannii TaxID=470 RepID=UPI001BB466E8|nr:hypothetical protein [Acinetobacter baumannii]MDG9779442.1 hypothetical protein [Acinetobacter baumannii]MDH0781484.1 hypothetical protein [Acinetobacter baumannii]
MKPEQFIREQGLPEVNRILEEAPKHSQFVIPCLDGEMYFSQREDDGKWFKWSTGYNKWLEYFGKCNPLDLAYSLSDLKRLVESLNMIESFGGINEAKEYDRLVDGGFFAKAIRDHESIYGGGHEY